MTRFYFIRHCEAEGNLYRRAQGQYDSRITPKGERQLGTLAERFRTVPADAVYSSDFLRARRTAEAVTRYRPLPVLTDPRLREWGLGDWEDVPFGNLEYGQPEMMACFNHDPARWSVPGGEPYAALQRRMLEFVLETAQRRPGQTLVCASHGMAIRSLLARVLDVPSAKIDTVGHGDNTAVSLLEVRDGAISVVFQNDAGHLRPEDSTLFRQTWWREPDKPDRNNIRFVPLDPERDGETYLHFYSLAWEAAHGSLRGFMPDLYLKNAREHRKAGQEALVLILRPDGRAVGMTELDLEKAKRTGAGWICLCCVEPDARRSLLGIQLIGHAVSVFRRMGCRAIRLNVFEGNRNAIAFYAAAGFRPVGDAPGVAGRLLVLEKEI